MIWFFLLLNLCGGLAVLQAPLFDGVLFDLFSLAEQLLDNAMFMKCAAELCHARRASLSDTWVVLKTACLSL